jgi:hypothetical protein
MEKAAGFFAPVLIYMLIFILNALLPGRWVPGYVTRENSSEKLRYHLNGLFVLFTVLSGWILLCLTGLLEWDWLYKYRWYGLAGGIASGLIFSFAMVLPFPRIKRSFAADFYLGRLANPRLWGGRIDAKMWLYLVGATMLELNVLSFAAHHYIMFGIQRLPGFFLATLLLTFFVTEYLVFEEVHLYTYDFVAERVGFKLGFGCLAFYPYFYAIPLWIAADQPDTQAHPYLLVLFVLLFFISWSFSRGANLQKFFFKKNPERVFLGIRPEILTDGKKAILVNGYWGLSRHINYMGEIGMAVAIVLCAGHSLSFWPWLYPLYYVALLVPRQIADDARCAVKYGALWNQYIKKVPYRIIPYIY